MLLDSKVRAFLVLAQTQSITGAADRVGLTQPALSKLLRRLEQDVGAPLFERHRRGISLTPEGETLLKHAQEAAIEFDHACEAIAASHNARKVELRIHCGLVYALDWIHEPLGELARRHPEVNFTIDAKAFENKVRRLLMGEYDAIFGSIGDEALDRRLEFTAVREVETWIFGRAEHPMAGRDVSSGDLAAALWCQFDDVYHTNERLHTYLVSTAGQEPRIRYRTSSLATALELVRSTDSLICLPSPLVNYTNERGLISLASGHTVWKYETGCLMRRTSANVALLRELASLVVGRATRP